MIKTIPLRLFELGDRFIRLRARDKIPLDKGWHSNAKVRFTATSKELERWLARGGNYGISLGNGLIVIDADQKNISNIVLERLPLTFTVETGRLPNPGLHFYYQCLDWDLGTKKLSKGSEHLGEIRSEGSQVVGTGSIHPTGGIYQVALDLSIEKITKAELIGALGEYLDNPNPKFKTPDTEPKAEHLDWPEYNINIGDIIPLPKGRYSSGKRYGEHPVHGSIRTGRNFTVNPRDNTWFCHRCQSGGGPLELLAVIEGIIDCSEAGKGSLRGKTFLQVLEIARKKGLLREEHKPLSLGEVSILKKEALAKMTPLEAKIKWNGYDIVLAEAPRKLSKVKKETKTGNIRFSFLWRGSWISAFMPGQLAKEIQGGRAYFLVGKLNGTSMNVRDAIPIGGTRNG